MSDPNTNPATLDLPGQQADIHRDVNSNPATYQGLGGPTSKQDLTATQTTIDTSSTTLHPNVSIVNPVTPAGTPAHDVTRQAPHPSVAAKVDETVKNKAVSLFGAKSTSSTGGAK